MKRRSSKGTPGVLVGVRAICEYASLGPQTFYKLHDKEEFPAMRLPDDRWCTSKRLIDEWIKDREKAQRAGKVNASDGGTA